MLIFSPPSTNWLYVRYDGFCWQSKWAPSVCSHLPVLAAIYIAPWIARALHLTKHGGLWPARTLSQHLSLLFLTTGPCQSSKSGSATTHPAHATLTHALVIGKCSPIDSDGLPEHRREPWRRREVRKYFPFTSEELWR